MDMNLLVKYIAVGTAVALFVTGGIIYKMKCDRAQYEFLKYV